MKLKKGKKLYDSDANEKQTSGIKIIKVLFSGEEELSESLYEVIVIKILKICFIHKAKIETSMQHKNSDHELNT